MLKVVGHCPIFGLPNEAGPATNPCRVCQPYSGTISHIWLTQRLATSGRHDVGHAGRPRHINGHLFWGGSLPQSLGQTRPYIKAALLPHFSPDSAVSEQHLPHLLCAHIQHLCCVVVTPKYSALYMFVGSILCLLFAHLCGDYTGVMLHSFQLCFAVIFLSLFQHCYLILLMYGHLFF